MLGGAHSNEAFLFAESICTPLPRTGRAAASQNSRAVCSVLVFNANETRIGDLSRNSGVMAARPRQRRPAPGRVAQGNVRLLAGIILLLGLLGFHAYKHWNAEPETVI